MKCTFFFPQTVKQRKIDVKATQDDLTMTIETFFDHELVSSLFFLHGASLFTTIST